MGVLNNGDKALIHDIVKGCLNDERARWVPRKVDWALVFAIILNAFILVYWVSTSLESLSNNSESYERRITAIEEMGYREADAVRDLALRDQKLSALRETVAVLANAQGRLVDGFAEVSGTLARLTAEIEADRRERTALREDLKTLTDRWHKIDGR